MKNQVLVIICITMFSCDTMDKKEKAEQVKEIEIVDEKIADFEVTSISFEEVKVYKGKEIHYTLSGKVKNISGEEINYAYVVGMMKLKFGDKVIEKRHTPFVSGIYDEVKGNNTWKVDEEREFGMKFERIDLVYKDYKPEIAEMYLVMNADGVLGYKVRDKIIYRKDFKDKWFE